MTSRSKMASLEAFTPDAPVATSLINRLRELRSGGDIPGLAFSLFNHTDELHLQLEGWRDREARLPVDEDTIFGVASITKSFTGLAVLQLAAAGLLSLDDPVTDHLPLTSWQPGREPSLRHLLNHTSGLPPLPTMTWLRGPTQVGDAISGSDAELVRKLSAARGGRLPPVGTFAGLIAYLNAEVTPLAAPGAQFSYSNDAFCLLGAVVAEVSGVPFDRFVSSRILQPLGMSRSTFDLQRVLRDGNRATLYAHDHSGAVRRSPTWEDAGVMQGGGALKSTLADLRRYTRFLMAPQRAGELGLTAEALREMASGTAWCGVNSSYGLGLQATTTSSGVQVRGHGGGLKGVSSHFDWLPDQGVGVVVLTNLGGQPSGLMALAGINAVTGVDVAEPAYRAAPYTPEPGEIDDLLGSYASGEPYGRLRLYLTAAGELRAEVGLPAEDLAVTMAGPDELALDSRWQQQPVSVLRDSAGAVSGVFQGLRVLARLGV